MRPWDKTSAPRQHLQGAAQGGMMFLPSNSLLEKRKQTDSCIMYYAKRFSWRSWIMAEKIIIIHRCALMKVAWLKAYLPDESEIMQWRKSAVVFSFCRPTFVLYPFVCFILLQYSFILFCFFFNFLSDYFLCKVQTMLYKMRSVN